jgi:hypothetical protein
MVKIFIQNFISLLEAKLKITLSLINIFEFEILFEKEDISNHSNKYVRWISIIKSKKESQIFEGMAEGHHNSITKLRSLAEAYEKLCLSEKDNNYDFRFPFGIGVGLSKNSAIRRAYGEFYERANFQLIESENKMEDSAVQTLDTSNSFGKIFVTSFLHSFYLHLIPLATNVLQIRNRSLLLYHLNLKLTLIQVILRPL